MTRKLQVSEEEHAEYLAGDAVIAQALKVLARRMKRPGIQISDPTVAKDYLRLHLGQLDTERFDVLFLDVKNRLLAHEQMFTGTINACSVYPREVVKAALRHNAASIMLAHNHPSGVPEPSESDLALTRALVQACSLIAVRVLDHFVVAGDECHSFAENGQL